MRVRRFIHFLLLVTTLVLLWQGVTTWSRTLPVPTPQRSLEEEPPLLPAPAPAPEAGRQWAEVIADKDLFSPSRSRALKESAPVATVPPPSHLKLVGVLLSSSREEAFFSDASQGGKVVRVRKGESLGSYSLAQVLPSQVTLTLGQGGEEVSLPLSVLESGAAAKAPHLVAAPPQPAALAGRLRQVRPTPAPAQAGPEVAPPQPPQDEAQAIRQNIQQLQQRLRQVRRQAAREEVSREKTGDEEEEEE